MELTSLLCSIAGERRRGASGRAAVLRRAPSDSDCSGETASLSADSGDRAVRPPPPPTRVAKSRSRRRGSEWEVLEGLKDGQRFEKRPDVFNGYLHKKRKWPLKGWHKRFFVVDGGILVYARSPTDVARGRLHGSVDVGLSVISAKARRRRIDIDADEFIYHLRAKTADVFRTWLNVLKAHRLYRQHLLTFGARESVPKIHPPLEDLPPTETSSRTSPISFTTSALTSNEDFKKSCSASLSSKCQEVQEIPPNVNVNVQEKCNDFEKVSNALYYNRSLCSMNCLTKLKQANVRGNKFNMSGSTNAEKQVHITDLESYSYEIDSPTKNETKNSDVNGTKGKQICPNTKKKKDDKSNSKYTYGKEESAYYFFSRKKRNPLISPPIEPPMKKSRKSTNLVKYRNMSDEPRLKDPPSKCLLLRQHNTKISRKALNQLYHRGIGCEAIHKESNQVQAVQNKEHKSLQDSMTASEYDRITEHLMISMFENQKIARNANKNEIKYYINEVVKELYNVKFNQADIHPVKILFRSLLEYWFKNTSGEQFKEAIKRVKSVQKPSNCHFTQDKILSSFLISSASKQTQFHGISSFINKTGMSNQSPTRASTQNPCKHRREKKTICHSPKRDTDSFEKERHIQKLERILKNTVYVCETVRSSQSREKDILITKKLIDNLEKLSKKPGLNNVNAESVDKNNSSSEIPQLQETINHLISETSIPPDVAKDFLNAYLSILLNESTKSTTDSSSQSCEDQKCHLNQLPLCDVQTESIQRKVSKHVSTTKCGDSDKQLINVNKEHKHPPDPGELYLKDILDKITTMFTKGSKSDSKKLVKNKKATEDTKITPKDKLGRSVEEFSKKNLIHENYDENAVVIDLSKYDLEHISMFSDTTLNGMMSISIEMKEKPLSFGGGKGQPLSLKLCNEGLNFTPRTHKNDWLNNLDSNTLKQIQPNDVDCKTDLCRNNSNLPQDTIELKPYTSSSDVSSKPYCQIVHESEHSIDLSFQSSNFFKKDYSMNEDEDTSCYIVSSVKKHTVPSKTEVKRSECLKNSNGIILGPQIRSPAQSSSSKYPEEYDLFEQPTPKVIDEKFILLLLENLMLLSKNLPTIYKDIRALYLKLKKKYEKVVRNGSNIQGLSLLGRIYNDDLKPNNRSIQFDEADFSETMKNTPRAVDVAVSTLTDVPILKILIDQSLSSYKLTNDSKTAEVQTDPVPDLKELMFKVSIPSIRSRNVHLVTKSKSAHSFLNRITTEQGVSCPNWHKKVQTKECAVDTIIKTILRSPEFNTKASIDPSKSIKNIQRNRLDNEFPLSRIQYNRDQILTAKKELVQGLAVLTPSLKTSTQSQTDKIFLKHSKDVKDNQFSTCNDFNIYRVVLCPREPYKSNSMISTANRELSDDLKTIYRCTSQPSYCSGLLSPTSPPIRGPQAGFVSGTPGGRLASWIIESGGPLENASRELGQAQLSVQQLQRLLEALELQQQVHHDTDVSLEGASPNVKKDRRKFGLRKKKSNSKCASIELAPPHIDPSSSHMALSALTAPPSPGGGASSVPNSAASLPIACAAARPQSLPGAESLGGGGVVGAGPASITSLTPDHQLREDFTVLAKDLVASLKGIVSTLVCERGRLRAAMDAADTTAAPGGAVVAALRTNLSSALHQNSELRLRLSRIHDASDLAEISSVGNNADAVNRQFQQSLSYSSSCVSASEFFDAEEHDDDLKPPEILAADEAGVIELDGDSSSEAGSLSSEEGSASSDNSDGAMLSAEQVTLRLNQNGVDSCWTRRTCLPRPRPTPGGPSLWNLLYKNIGKDLSQISMPVTINEPLNMLQRLCEELEYSELLDAAADCVNAIERAALVASFAVSAYAASAHRAASKPFNPLLGETYECVRQDKGFRFLAEQVSHHPPISACHAESSRWCFWQEARIKTKFWGKSMEFQPTGRVHVRLITTGDHYSWNKVTTCVHNLFGGQRWVDQYGDMHITCHGTDISCKLNFIKASSWSSTRHEVRGYVTGGDSRLRLQGRWSEALYAGEPPSARALWRPGAMPPEHELYYGFTRFAMELNEIEPGMRELLPPTDTRLRPDQRALEEGDVEAAEQYKHSLEQAQRERRRGSPEHTAAWFRKRVENGEETWVFTGEYWKAREAGFGDSLPRIW